MAKIQMGSFTIRPDIGGTGWVLAQLRAKSPRGRKDDVVGYFPRLEHAIDRLLEERLRASDATGLRAVIDEVRAFRSELHEELAATAPVVTVLR